jgi:hypothetical protein
MSIVYKDKFFRIHRVLFAIVDQANIQNKHPLLFNKLKDFTYTTTTRISTSTKGHVQFFDDIDTAMEYAKNKYDIVIIQSIGNFIKNNELIEHIYQYYRQNPNFFLLSFTLDWDAEKGDGWVECHNQMMVVNVKTWKTIGTPIYGGWETVTEELPNYSRSEENFHDKYTPYWIKGESGTSVKTRKCQGWGFIKAALSHGLQIDNFSQDMRNCRLYIYPESNSDALYQAFLTKDSRFVDNPNQKKWIKGLLGKPTVWIYNSEHYTFGKDLSGCDVYFGPAAGFKYLDILNYSDNVKFIFYDNSQLSLDWIKSLKENWNGENFPKYLKSQPEELKKCYKYINKTVDNNQEKLFSDFKNETHFKELWKRFAQSDATFINCDIFDINQLIDLISVDANQPLFYYSNIFSTDYTIVNHTLDEVTAYYEKAASLITERYPSAITYGANPLGEW